MTVEDLRELREKENMSYEIIAELSGIPLEVVTKIFTGEIKEPQYMSLLAMEQVIVRKKKIPFYYDKEQEQPCLVREQVAYNFDARRYYLDDVKQLCAGVRVEIIDGKLHTMNTPNRMHQFLSMNISARIFNHIDKNNGKCHIYTAPLGVRLFSDDKTWVEPDILVVCKRKEILTEQGCDGAPDLIVEIVSPNNYFHDYVRKMIKYQQAGVREYWIVDPRIERVSVACFENTEKNAEYHYNDVIPSYVLEGFEIRISDFIDKFTE